MPLPERYNKNNGMSVILINSAFKISKFYCRYPSGSLIYSRLKLSGQIGSYRDRRSKQPIHVLSMTHREAAIFDDACTVPTPCLLLPGMNGALCKNGAQYIYALRFWVYRVFTCKFLVYFYLMLITSIQSYFYCDLFSL